MIRALRVIPASLLLASMLAAEPPPHAPRAAVVPVEVLASNHLMVAATINGKGPFRLIVDVGSPITLLSRRTAEASGVVKPGGAPLLASLRGETAARALRIGDLTVADLPVIVFDHPTLRALGAPPPDGLIGFTLLSRYRTTLDCQARTLTFEPVDFRARDVLDLDLDARGRDRERRIVAPGGLFGLTVAEPADPLTAAGVEVVAVLAGSPAEAAGLRPGDVLAALDGRWTCSVVDALAAASKAAPGRAVEAAIVRDGAPLTLRITPTDGL